MVVVAQWSNGLVLHQLLAGYEYAKVTTQEEADAHPIWVNAIDMRNFVYLIADKNTRQAVAVDACWDVDGIYEHAASEGLSVIGSIYTHFHLDHTGGWVAANRTATGEAFLVDGVKNILEKGGKAWIGEYDLEKCIRQSWANPGKKEPVNYIGGIHGITDGEAILPLGESFPLRCMHTPGHTPGSICYLLGDEEGQAVLTGDTLFIGSCGRVDNGTGSLQNMFNSLQLLKGLDDTTVVFPAHNYDEQQRRYVVMGEEKQANTILRLKTVEQLTQVIGPEDNSRIKPNPTSNVHELVRLPAECGCACRINHRAVEELGLLLPLPLPLPLAHPSRSSGSVGSLMCASSGLPMTASWSAFNRASMLLGMRDASRL